MPLTDSKIKATLPGERPRKLFDGQGLHLVVTPAGGRLWRLKYRHGGMERTLSIGKYPQITLKRARDKAAEARALLAEGIDPSATKRQQKELTAHSFEQVARDWYARRHLREVVPEHASRNLRRLERLVFPAIGTRPVADLTAPDVLDVLRRIEARGHAETASRVRSLIGQVFRHAVGAGLAARDVTADLRGQLAPARTRHHAAITDPTAFAALLRAVWDYPGQPATAAALKLAPMLFVRPGELRQARWDEIDLNAAEWSFRASKTGEDLVVPLPHQAVAILEEMDSLRRGSPYVFPGARSIARPMSSNTLTAALRRLDYSQEEVTPHGFRASARTLLVERLSYPEALVEQQLGHRVRDIHGRAYNRTTFLAERREMMQRWACYLDQLREGAQVVSIASSVPGA